MEENEQASQEETEVREEDKDLRVVPSTKLILRKEKD